MNFRIECLYVFSFRGDGGSILFMQVFARYFYKSYYKMRYSLALQL